MTSPRLHGLRWAALLLAGVACAASWRVARADAIADAAKQAYLDNEAAYNFEVYANSPQGHLLGWGESYILMGALSMHEATGEARHLQRVLDHAESIVANRADRLGAVDQLRNRLMPAWTTGQYTNGVPYAWGVHAGMVGAPIARAAYLVKRDPQLDALYGDRADRYIDDLIETAVGFDSDWRQGPKPGEGHYREFTLNAVSPYNQQNALGRMYVALYQATGQQRFRDRAEALARFTKDDLRLVGDRYDWAYSTSSSGSEDLSHAAINVDFAFRAYQAGIVFDETDMRRFANTFVAMSRGADGFTARVSATGALEPSSNLAGRWVHLGYFDPAVRTAFYAYFKDHPTQGGLTWGSTGAAYLAETARPFAFNGPLPQPDRTRVRLAMEPGQPLFAGPSVGGRSQGVTAGSGVAYDDTDPFEGTAAQRITARDDPSVAGGWTLEIAAGDPLALDRAGYVGLWMRTDTDGVFASLLVDDLGGLERSTGQTLLADGQWHLYQWNFDDAAQWDALTDGTGALEGLQVTLRSLILSGGPADAVVYADNWITNLTGPIVVPEPAALGSLAPVLVLIARRHRRRRHR